MDADQVQTTEETVLQTAEALIPAIAAAGSVASPQVAAITALAPVALKFLQSAIDLQNMGIMTPDQLATMFATIGQNVQASHNAWVAMNPPVAK